MTTKLDRDYLNICLTKDVSSEHIGKMKERTCNKMTLNYSPITLSDSTKSIITKKKNEKEKFKKITKIALNFSPITMSDSTKSMYSRSGITTYYGTITKREFDKGNTPISGKVKIYNCSCKKSEQFAERCADKSFKTTSKDEDEGDTTVKSRDQSSSHRNFKITLSTKSKVVKRKFDISQAENINESKFNADVVGTSERKCDVCMEKNNGTQATIFDMNDNEEPRLNDAMDCEEEKENCPQMVNEKEDGAWKVNEPCYICNLQTGYDPQNGNDLKNGNVASHRVYKEEGTQTLDDIESPFDNITGDELSELLLGKDYHEGLYDNISSDELKKMSNQINPYKEGNLQNSLLFEDRRLLYEKLSDSTDGPPVGKTKLKRNFAFREKRSLLSGENQTCEDESVYYADYDNAETDVDHMSAFTKVAWSQNNECIDNHDPQIKDAVCNGEISEDLALEEISTDEEVDITKGSNDDCIVKDKGCNPIKDEADGGSGKPSSYTLRLEVIVDKDKQENISNKENTRSVTVDNQNIEEVITVLNEIPVEMANMVTIEDEETVLDQNSVKLATTENLRESRESVNVGIPSRVKLNGGSSFDETEDEIVTLLGEVPVEKADMISDDSQIDSIPKFPSIPLKSTASKDQITESTPIHISEKGFPVENKTTKISIEVCTSSKDDIASLYEKIQHPTMTSIPAQHEQCPYKTREEQPDLLDNVPKENEVPNINVPDTEITYLSKYGFNSLDSSSSSLSDLEESKNNSIGLSASTILRNPLKRSGIPVLQKTRITEHHIDSNDNMNVDSYHPGRQVNYRSPIMHLVFKEVDQNARSTTSVSYDRAVYANEKRFILKHKEVDHDPRKHYENDGKQKSSLSDQSEKLKSKISELVSGGNKKDIKSHSMLDKSTTRSGIPLYQKSPTSPRNTRHPEEVPLETKNKDAVVSNERDEKYKYSKQFIYRDGCNIQITKKSTRNPSKYTEYVVTTNESDQSQSHTHPRTHAHCVQNIVERIETFDTPPFTKCPHHQGLDENDIVISDSDGQISDNNGRISDEQDYYKVEADYCEQVDQAISAWETDLKEYSYDFHGRKVLIENGLEIAARYREVQFVEQLMKIYTRRDLLPYQLENEKLQQQLIDGMFKYAEQKYGRKRASEKEEEKSTVKEDYELYLRSLKTKVKQANDKLNAVLRQRKEFEKKVDDAQKDAEIIAGKLTKAEEEKANAANENRDPTLPKEFMVPQRTKRLGASLGALVMKASTQDWGAALAAFASSRKSAKATGKADWGVKRDKTAVLLKAGQKDSISKPKEEAPKEEAPKEEAPTETTS